MQSCRQFCDAGGRAAGGQEEAVRQARGAARCRAVPRRRVRRRQDPPAGVVVLPTFAAASAPAAFATFGELTQLAGVFGFVECIDLLADYVVVCIDEFELDDPGNTTLISRLLSQLVERGVSVAATSNTLPEQLGEGRFAAQDFLREINTLAAIFTTVRIEGPDYRHRDLPPAPEPLSDDEVATARRRRARRDARRLRRVVRAPGDHASVAVSDADRGRDGGVHHRRASDRRPERGAAAGVADRPALRRGHPGGGVGHRSWTPSSATRCWRAASARSTCGRRRGCWR